MKTFTKAVVFFATLLLVVGIGWSSDYHQAVNMQLAQASEPQAQPVQPPSPAPTNLPPSPPTETPAPPADETQASDQQVAPKGQWVYTDQYGWVWMPYGDAYTYVPSNGAEPDMYVYYPAVGWCWVVAPWLWGLGPVPYFGIYGPWYFGWYGHGYGHWYGFVGHHGYAGWGGRGYWHGGQWHGYSRFSPGHQALPNQGGFGVSPRSGYRVPAGHGFAMHHEGLAGRGGFSGHSGSGHSFAASRGGFSGGGGHGGHGGHGR